MMSRVCVLLMAFVGTNAMQLVADPTNACKATGNGTQFDISKVMKWPVQVTGPRYNYTFSPCEPIPCSGDPNNKQISICQYADFPRSCGNGDQALWFLQSFSPVSWKILYPNGQSWRATWVTFRVDESLTETKITSIEGEQPYEIYNFEVTGRCLGQPYQPADC